MKIAIYSRKSKFTRKGESTENQVQLCIDYAKKYFSFEPNELLIYEDEGFSGGTIERPKLKELLAECKRGKVNMILCYRLDRISRNIYDFCNIIDLLNSNSINFVSIREQFDTSTPLGRAMMYIASVFAQLERETIAERIVDNLLELSKSGRWLGGITPTGFASKIISYIDSNGNVKNMSRLIQVPNEVDLIKLLYGKFLELKSITKLQHYCNQNKIYSKNNKPFSKVTLKGILINPVYSKADLDLYNYLINMNVQIFNSKEEFNGEYGIMVYNKTIHTKGKSVKFKNTNSWIAAIGLHKGIINGSDWIKVQDLLTLHIRKN